MRANEGRIEKGKTGRGRGHFCSYKMKYTFFWNGARRRRGMAGGKLTMCIECERAVGIKKVG